MYLSMPGKQSWAIMLLICSLLQNVCGFLQSKFDSNRSNGPNPDTWRTQRSVVCGKRNLPVDQGEISHDPYLNRRNLMTGIGIATFWAQESQCVALDYDSFISSELNVDQLKKEVTQDEKICKYAAPGQEKGEACARAGMKTEGKRRGGVDAYGNIDRGNFVRCMTSYPLIDGKYVKTVICE